MKTVKKAVAKKAVAKKKVSRKKKSILKLIKKKPSVALAYMVKGLRNARKQKNFCIDMMTYGDYSPDTKICFGCAATATAQELGKRKFVNGETLQCDTRAKYLGFDYAELNRFEDIIDDARRGDLEDLFSFCGIDPENVPVRLLRVRQSLYLNSDFTARDLKGWETVIRRLKKAGY